MPGDREVFLDEQDRPGYDADVIPEKHSPQSGDGRGEIDELLCRRLGVSLHDFR
jgi:hypothetical protein